jgi:thiamine pyrophosphate-dependent acetolactate synthase large subunit-like protein
VLLVNCRAPWYPPSARPASVTTTVVLDEVPQRPHIVYQVLFADQYLEGTVADTLQQATAALCQRALPQALIAERRARHKLSHDKLVAGIDAAEAKSAAATGTINAVQLLAELRALAPPDSIFVDETITHSRLVQQHLRLDEPERYYYVQGGLGQGIAVALGVKLAAGQRPVILTVGDGSWLYNPVLPSLAAARNFKLPLLMVIFNNRQYLSMKYNHLRCYPDSVAAATGVHLGVDLSGQPDLASSAAAFGMFGTTVSDPAGLRAALQAGLAAVAAGHSAVINVLLEK